SSGMRVRLAFAVAAHLEPDILIVDEVLAVGDAEFQKKAIGKMQDISKGDGRTVLFVSHNMAAVKSLCTRGIVLENGKMIFEGDTNIAIQKYLQNFSQVKINYENREVITGIKTINFFNSKETEINSIVVGEKVKVKFMYSNNNHKKISISIGFFDSYLNFMFSCRSDIIDVMYDKNEGEAILIIDKWPLSEGYYSYNIGVHLGNQVIESVKNAGGFNVLRGDFYGSGKLPGHKKSFYIDYKYF
ncbi:MAG: ABC transporter ATP-binding protein, partial [Flavobacteriaceae bacterium]|nr:ABC transporter ATP-binding protein [Flavobacteriaceae bacterium]